MCAGHAYLFALAECYRCEEERVTEASLLFQLERRREGGLYLRFLERVYRVLFRLVI